MTMRIAIAGGGGFAHILAREIAQNANAVIVLSTRHHYEFEELGVQVAVVDYTNPQELRYILKGVDLLISTIREETTQLNLINAARHARVHTFVPAEFEGAVAQRPTSNDPFDHGSGRIRQYLNNSSSSSSSPASNSQHTLRYTVFSCGVLYERFAPGGLGRFNMGRSANVWRPGDYLLNIETAQADIVLRNAQGRPVTVSMTSVCDVARFVAAAVDIGLERWPREFRMRGDQMSLEEIVHDCSMARRVPFSQNEYEYAGIQAMLDFALQESDVAKYFCFQQLRVSVEGRYDFTRANLNETINQTAGLEVRPVRFRDWIWRACEEAQMQS
ncbi:hypothetical protein N0V82_009262 [Gnomoniopsis sp. IMI 355080]|nr:hypothetical protein N0V82_009262 [Gnomoniopsis sp. IMI 355080]